jgi:hypothetical protein
MKLKHFIPVAVALAAALAGAASTALAVPVTVTGSTFDISYDNDYLGLFGAPTLVGNQLAWFPSGSPGFAAQSAAGIAVTNSTFAVQVTAHPGYTLGSFGLAEGGDYFYFGSGSGVSVSGQLRVTPLPGTGVINPVVATSTFAANAAYDFGTHNWAAEAALVTLPDGTTAANASLQNILAVYVAGPASYAFIEKKDVLLTINVSAVPEPPSLAMVLAGVGAIGFIWVRRRGRG